MKYHISTNGIHCVGVFVIQFLIYCQIPSKCYNNCVKEGTRSARLVLGGGRERGLTSVDNHDLV